MTVADMRITALAPWFGGKRTLAPVIVQELGKHSSYFEPFVGGLSIVLQKPRSCHENINDLHGDIINLARVVKDSQLGPMLYRRLRRVILHENLYDDARRYIQSCPDMPEDAPPDLGRAFWYFCMSWMGRNGVSGTQVGNTGFCRRWTPHGGHGGTRLTSAVESIPAWRRRLRAVTVTRMDGFEFLAQIHDVEGTAIYCDPPYIVKAGGYVHDFDGLHHHQLAKLLLRFTKARVVVSYYEHSWLAELYPSNRWTKRSIEVAKSMSHQNKRGANKARATEVLLINGESYAESHP